MSQDKIYFDAYEKETKDTSIAEFYKKIYTDKTFTNTVVEKSYYLNGAIKSEINFSNYKEQIKYGYAKSWYENGQLKEKATYKENKLNDTLITYWSNGNLKRVDYFNMGKLINGQLYNFDGTATAHYDYEIAAEFPGGLNKLADFIGKNIKYPKAARKNGIEGKVFLRFIVDTEGHIQHVEVLKGVSPEIDEEAIRVIKIMPQWRPAMVDGNKVNSFFNLPLSFKLTDPN